MIRDFITYRYRHGAWTNNVNLSPELAAASKSSIPRTLMGCPTDSCESWQNPVSALVPYPDSGYGSSVQGKVVDLATSIEDDEPGRSGST